MSAELTPIRLRIEGAGLPEGTDLPSTVDILAPHLAWWLDGAGSDRCQGAYRILVASRPEDLDQDVADLWDSGKVGTATQTATYAGRPLQSRQAAFWKVMVWDEQQQAGLWSACSSWEMGLLNPGDWTAHWIEHEVWSRADEPRPSPVFRSPLHIPGPVRRARLYVSALGLYEARINGRRVGDFIFAPGWTDYHTRVPYQTYDVTALLQEGENVVGALIGDGWYCGYLGFRQERRHYGPRPRLRAQLEVELETGEWIRVSTGASWKTSTGAVLSSDFLMGETYDAGLEQPGWDRSEFDDSGWKGATTVRWHAPMVADEGPPVRALLELPPVSETRVAPGVRIFDLGQNVVGWARIRVQGQAGQRVTLRFAEMLNPDGTLYVEALRSAKTTDTYFCRGGTTEVYEPHFTFHGFRYVEVTGDARLAELTGVVIGSDTPVAGTFSCSNPDLNQLQSNIVWGQRGNFLSVPTDCPQRDERLGWLGDAQVFAPTAMLNADAGRFFSKWMQDVLDAQSPAGGFPDVAPRVVTEQDGAPGWGNGGVIVPWTIWTYGGDLSLVERCWEGMERWMTYLEEVNPDGLWLNRRSNDFGDWLAQDGADPANAFGSLTPKDVVATAYWANDARLMAEMAGALGKVAEQVRYAALYAHIRAAFQQAYLEQGGWIAGHTQTGQTLALRFGLLPEAARDAAFLRLTELIEARDGHLTTGFLGVGHLLPVLADGNRPDVAHRLLTQDTFPSWLYSVRQGATTIWERWDGYTREGGFQTPEMNSFNHYSLGSVGQWLFEGVAGLKPTAPGFRSVRIAPQPGELAWARATHDSPQGRYEVSWQVQHDEFTLDFLVPVGGTATVQVPAPFRLSTGSPTVFGSGRHTLLARRHALTDQR